MRESDAIDDEWLAIRCQLGEPAAFDELVARWHRPLSRYVLRLAGPDAAADLVQDTWLRIVRGLPGLRDATRLRAWMFGIARRVVMDRLRRKYAAPTFVPIDVEPAADTEETTALAEDLAALEAGLDLLPLAERDVLVLFYLDELSIAQIADVCAVPVGTVKSRLFRARRLLRTQLMRGDAT